MTGIPFPAITVDRSDETRLATRPLDVVELSLVRDLREMENRFKEILHEIGGTEPDTERFAGRHLALAYTHAEDAFSRAFMGILDRQ